MATPPVFSAGSVLTAAQMNAIGLWAVTPTSVTGGTLSGDVVTIGTNVASVVVSGAFNSDFINYRIIINDVNTLFAGVTGVNIDLVGITANVYKTSGFYMAFNSTTLNGIAPGLTNFVEVGTGSGDKSDYIIDVCNPNVAKHKTIHARNVSTAGTGYMSVYSGMVTSTSTATAFTFKANAGNLTGGTIRVYGYRD